MDIQASRQRGPNRFLLPAASTIAFFLLTIPVWRWLWQEWMGNEYYSHGILIPLTVAFLMIQRIRNDDSFTWRSDQRSVLALVLLGTGVILLLVFLNIKAYYLASFAMVLMAAGLVGVLGGEDALRKLAFPIAFLCFMIPLPFIERTTLPLALFTGVCSGGLVRFLGLDVAITGNAVTLPNTNLIIGAQCSGINSLITLIALTVLMTYLFSGPWWGRILLALSAIPLALLGNILRVSSLLYVARNYGADAAFTFYHDYSGPLFFVAILLLLFPLSNLLRCRSLRPEVV